MSKGVKSYQFDVDVAEKYGVDEAVILRHLQFWIFTNRANGRHFHEGRTWTYGSVRAFAEIWPFWSIDHISRKLNKLVAIGVLVKGNYNFSGYDRTNWYAFVNEKTWFLSREAILQKRQMDGAKVQNGFAKSAKSKTNQRTDKSTIKSQNKGVEKMRSRKKSVALVAEQDHEIVEAAKSFVDLYNRLLRPVTRRDKTALQRRLAFLVRGVESGKFDIGVFQQAEDFVKRAKTDGQVAGGKALFTVLMKEHFGFNTGKTKNEK